MGLGLKERKGINHKSWDGWKKKTTTKELSVFKKRREGGWIDIASSKRTQSFKFRRSWERRKGGWIAIVGNKRALSLKL